MPYKKIKKIDSRIMADKSISKSFKGILRIAHILDAVDTSNNEISDDLNKLSTLFYRNFRTNDSRKLIDINGKVSKDNTIGYPKAYPYGLDESNPISRYKSDDPFINAKLPICDSLGNYININVGLNGIVFGSNESIGKATTEIIDIDGSSQLKYFPVLTSKHLVVGMEEIKKASNKNVLAENVSISINDSIDDKNVTAKIIVDHNTADDIKTRTIYNIAEGNYADNYGLIASQENWERESFKALTIDGNLDKTLAFKTELIDLADYVKDRIDKYIKSNAVQVPTGSVIWEYVSLWNYYAMGDTGFKAEINDNDLGTPDKNLEFGGHRPKLTSVGTTTYPFKNTLFNTDKNPYLVQKTNKLLGRNPNDGNASFKEIIPLYKRDYVLCDGKKYYISPSKDANLANKNGEFDRLINLFLAIGYHYSDIKENTFLPCIKYNDSFRYIIKIDNNYKIVNADTIREITSYGGKGILLKANASKLYDLKNISNIQDLLWSNDITSLLAYRILNNISSDTYANGRKAVEEELQKEKIPNEYAYYGVLADDECQSITYNIPSTSDYGPNFKSINFKLGKEIINFKSKITIPVIDGNYSIDENYNIKNFNINYNISYKTCELYQHPAVQAFIDLISNNSGKNATDRWINAAATFGFKVPNFNMNYNTKIVGDDSSILNSTKYSNTGNNGIGGFMGTCAWTWVANKFDTAKQFDYTCNATESNIPHRHRVFKGYSYNKKDTLKEKSIYEYMGYQPAQGPNYVSDCGTDTEPCYYRLFNTIPFGAIDSTIYLDTNTYAYMINMYPVKVDENKENSKNFFSNILHGDNDNDEIIRLNGSIIEPNRCISSKPKWINGSSIVSPMLEYNKANQITPEEDGGFIDFFSPECLYMVPLIKL